MSTQSENATNKKKNDNFLFNNDSSDSSEDESLKINPKYAKDFEDRKRHEDLNRAKRLGIDEDESVSEEEDEGDELTLAKDAQIMKVLQMIRNKDPKIYDKNVNLYENINDQDQVKKTKKEKKMTVKDALRQEILNGGVQSDDEEDKVPVKTYTEEMDDLKQELIKATNDIKDDDDDEDFFVKRPGQEEDEETLESYVEKKIPAGENTPLKQYIQSKPKDEKEKFLYDFVNQRKWKENDIIPTYKDIVEGEKENDDDADTKIHSDVDLEEDMAELEQADRFESTYNFRFEDQQQLQTFPREIEGSLRRKDNKRKKERQEKKMRQESEMYRKREELKRLKKLREAEIEKKLKEIQEIAGKEVDIDVESDFDPEKYDKEMDAIYNDEYYQQEEKERPNVDIEKEFGDDEKDIYIDKDIEKEKEEEEEERDIQPIEMNEEEKKKNEENMKLLEQKQKELDKLYDDLYKLDYEDIVGGVQVRFPYKQVVPRDYGLSTEEILVADDKDLKQYISIKRMNPYLDNEYDVKRQKTKQFKKELKSKIDQEVEEREKAIEESKKNKLKGKKKAKQEKQKKNRHRKREDKKEKE
ncbi:hypothetical protein WA158_004143 [Blastocystis sp. Blastoise]